MAEEKRRGFPIEYIAAAVLVFVIMVFMFRQCSGRKATPARTATNNTAAADSTARNRQTGNAPAAAAGESVVYVSIDSLRMRRGPHKDSSVVELLRLNEPIYFSGERTAFLQKMKLNGEFYNKPWLKVRTVKGKRGWVYGGGVEPYRQ